MVQTTPKRKQHAPRSKDGCHRCRVKRVRCTKEKPFCAKCVKAKDECVYPNQPGGPPSPADSPQADMISSPSPEPTFGTMMHQAHTVAVFDWPLHQLSSRQIELTQLYWNNLAPRLGGLTNTPFYIATIIPIGARTESVYSGVISLTHLLARTSIADQDGRSQNNRDQLERYNASLAHFINNYAHEPPGLRLLTAMLYAFIEREQKNQPSAEMMLKTAFENIFSLGSVQKMWVATCLPVLLECLVTSTIDSSCVPLEQSHFVAGWVKTWSHKFEFGQLHDLRAELFSIMHDCQTFMFRHENESDGKRMSEYAKIMDQLQAWWSRFWDYQRSDEGSHASIARRLKGIRTGFRMTWILLEAEVCGGYRRTAVSVQTRSLLEEFTEIVEDTTNSQDTSDKSISSTMERAFFPTVAFLAWHANSESLKDVEENLEVTLSKLKKFCTTTTSKQQYDAAMNLVVDLGKEPHPEESKPLKMCQYFDLVARLAPRPVELKGDLSRKRISDWLDKQKDRQIRDHKVEQRTLEESVANGHLLHRLQVEQGRDVPALYVTPADSY